MLREIDTASVSACTNGIVVRNIQLLTMFRPFADLVSIAGNPPSSRKFSKELR
jgi:hypothetical protein